MHIMEWRAFRLIVHGTFAVILVFSDASTAQQSETPKWTPEQQEFIDAVSQIDATILKPQDKAAFDLFFSRYASDYSYWEVGTRELRTLDIQRQRVTRYINRGNRVTSITSTPIDVKLLGNIGILRSYSVETIKQSNDEELVIRFYAVDIYQKQDDRWLHISKNIIYVDNE